MNGIAPQPEIPPDVLQEWNVRVLDPATCVRNPAYATVPLQPTAYVADSLLVRGLPDRGVANEARELLEGVAKEYGWGVGPFSRRDLEMLRLSDGDQRLDAVWTSRLRLLPSSDAVAPPPDAWTLLQAALHRGNQGGIDFTDRISLEHIVVPGDMWGWVGDMWGWVGDMWGWVGRGIDEYGYGQGGRIPVSWAGPNPSEGKELGKGPVVAILDTGLGMHPWYFDGVGKPLPGVVIDPRVAGQPVGKRPGAAENPEASGVVSDLLNGPIDDAAGHGTFVTGVVRQRCPEATVVPVVVLNAHGLGREHDILLALNQLAYGHLRARGGSKDDLELDVVNLSLGYYHESFAMLTAASPVARAIAGLVELGVDVVAAAGNGATTAEFVPAALVDLVPGLHSVGALNPDGRTVALFSNGGAWVRLHAVGGGVVSTVPVTLAGSAASRVLSTDPTQSSYPVRAAMDPDDHGSGFALWSGTSFAAPWVAGDLAHRRHEGR